MDRTAGSRTRPGGGDPGPTRLGQPSGPRFRAGLATSGDATSGGATSGRPSNDLDWQELVKRTVRSSAFWGIVLAVATWADSGHASLEPLPGLDDSWQASLYMQAHMGMAAGSHGVFTYGPLGFLGITRLYYPGLTLLALIYQGAMAAAIYGLLVLGIRRFAPLTFAVLAALLAGAPMVVTYGGPEGWIAVGCFCTIYVIRQPADRPASVWWWGAVGVMAGLNILVKSTVGVYLVLACLVILACAPRGEGYRRVCALLGSGVAAFLIGWVGTGNGVSNFIGFAKGAEEVASGYSSAMWLSPPPIAGSLMPPSTLSLMCLAAIGLGVTAVVTRPQPASRPATGPKFGCRPRLDPGSASPETTSSLPQPGSAGWRAHRATLAAFWLRIRVSVGVILSLGLALLFLYKEAVVRQGPGVYFASLPILFVAALIGRPLRVRGLGRAGLIALVLSATLVGYLPSAKSNFDVSLPAGVGGFLGQVTTVLADSGPKISQYRAALQSGYALPPKVLDRIGSRTVAIDPWEDTIAWAYPQLRWDPLPVIQDYSAYTTYLDSLDANFLASSRAPEYVLRQSISMDGRSPTLDPPQTQLELACRYRDVGEFNSWQLLEAVPDRCGTPTPIGTVHTGYGQTITVPSAPLGDMITARVSLQKSLIWDLLNLVYKPPGFYLSINDSPGSIRFISGTAGDMHMIRAPASLAWGSGFAPTPIRTMTINEENNPSTSSGVVVHFYAVPMS